MYELIQVEKNTYYINCPAKIGLYRTEENNVYLINSGNDKDAGRRVRKILDENNWNLLAIINTHSNADHIGGNKYLENNTGCKIFAPGIEAAFTKYTILEPSFLYGAYPFKELRHKFLMAQESNALDISHSDFPEELEVIPLPGHFFHMIGIRTPDNVVFLADCISSRDTIEKYKIPFIYNVSEYLETLDRVKKLDASNFVPAHTEASKDILDLVDFNERAVMEIKEKILEILTTPMNFETLLKNLFDEYCLTINYEQYVLVGSTVKSFLSWLKDEGKVEGNFIDNYLLWSKSI